MSKKQKIIYWLPRILGILFALFISLFALDVFGEEEFFWIALIMHLVPTFLVLVALLVGWKWPKVGGVLFLLFGGFYIWTGLGDLISVLIISGPLFLIGILFLLNKKHEEKFII